MLVYLVKGKDKKTDLCSQSEFKYVHHTFENWTEKFAIRNIMVVIL